MQTGTAHGGFINADGTLRMDVKIDLKTLEELSRVARKDYGLGGAVQHGASTLPPEAFDAFPRAGACEIHLATDFQNMVYEHAQFPADLKAEMYAWIRENATEERKPKDTEEQFIYKARKKAIGPFKQRMWGLGDERARAIGQSLEERFSFLMKQLKINDTARRRVAVRHGAADCRSTARRRSSPPAARSRPPRKRPKDSQTDRAAAGITNARRHEEDSRRLRALAFVSVRRRVRAASHDHGLVLRVDRPGSDGHDLPRRLSRVHGRDGDAVRPEGRRAQREADARRSRAASASR